jgi:hypothetical protein
MDGDDVSEVEDVERKEVRTSVISPTNAYSNASCSSTKGDIPFSGMAAI